MNKRNLIVMGASLLMVLTSCDPGVSASLSNSITSNPSVSESTSPSIGTSTSPSVETSTSPSVSIPTSYVPRNNNYAYFFIEVDNEKAEYYYYATYLKDSIRISVDIIDDNIITTYGDIGYNDNIEFNIQPMSLATNYEVNQTHNFMINIGQDQCWVRKATGAKEFSNNLYYSYINSGLFSYERTQKYEDLHGYTGYSIEIDLAYSIWNKTYDDLYGKLTIEPSARNSLETGATEYRSYVEKGCRFAFAYTALVINGDGSFSQNVGEVTELTPLMEKKGLIYNEKDLASNFASITDNSRSKLFGNGSQMFNDRKYFVIENVPPRELIGKTYYYDAIEATKTITIDKAGYVVVLAPSTGYDSLLNTIRNYGFNLINDNYGKQLGTSSSGTIGITECSNYYVRWCERGQSFTLGKWCLIFTKELEASQYPNLNRWERELGQVNKISSEETLAEYAPSDRLWQGIPGIEAVKHDNGGTRLWGSLFTGGTHEPTIYNHALYYFSDDDGDSWTLAFVIDFDGDKEDDSRIFDPSIKYHDGKLYLYWNQTGALQYTNMTCCAILENPGMEVNKMSDINNFNVGESFFCSRGIKMNKPIVLPSGEWLYCAHDPANQNNVEVYSSLDNGLTFTFKGQSRVNNVQFVTESTLVYTDDIGKELVMYSRTDFTYNLGVSYSHDGGLTWTDAVDNGTRSASSRVNSRRLESGNILLAHHYDSYAREKMYVGLSTNGCKSYDHNLILDVRNGVSYPDITQSEDGSIYVCWDYDRYGMKQVLFTKLTEEELLSIDGVKTMDTSRIKEMCSIVTKDHTYSISGYVKDENNNAIKNATVTCNNVVATTNNDGRYELTNIEFANSGNNELSVSAQDYTIKKVYFSNDHVIDYNYHLKHDITLNTITYGTYTGKILDIDKKPISGVTVKIDGDEVATTNSLGEYQINNYEIMQCDFTFEKAGYKTATLKCEPTSKTTVSLETLVMMKSTQCDLGEVGGTNGNKYHVFSERGENGITFIGYGETTLSNSTEALEIWINVYGYSRTRSINTSFYTFKQDNTFTAKYLPNGNAALMADKTGITNTVSGNSIKGYIPYNIIGQYLPTGISVNKNTELALNMITTNSANNKFDYWQAENIPGIKDVLTGEIDKFNTKKYITLTKDNNLSTEHSEWFTMGDIQALVANSAHYSGQTFSMSTLASASNNKFTQQFGGKMYSDRETSVHAFDDYRLKALDGYKFIANPVLSNVTFTVTKSGYILICYMPANMSTPTGFTDIIVNYSNPGVGSSPSHALFNYAVIYAEAGQTFSIPKNSFVYIN